MSFAFFLSFDKPTVMYQPRYFTTCATVRGMLLRNTGGLGDLLGVKVMCTLFCGLILIFHLRGQVVDDRLYFGSSERLKDPKVT